jgi:hypothetical protein
VAQIRDLARANMLRLLKNGPGIHAYTLHRAQELEAQDSYCHHGLVELVKATLGPAAARKAESDIRALLGTPPKKSTPR